MQKTPFFIMIPAVLALSACDLAIGQNQGICDSNPEKCQSVSAAYAATNGPLAPPGTSAVPLGPLTTRGGLTPPNTDTVSLENGKTMRIWTAPYTDQSGALHVSGYTFVEMKRRQWEVGLTNFHWTSSQ